MDKKMGKEYADKALQALRDSFGINHKVEIKGNWKYSPSNGCVIITFVIPEPGVAGETETEWNLYADMLGLDVRWLGKQFVGHDGDMFTVTGCKPRGRRYPVAIVDSQGVSRKCAAAYVRSSKAVEG